MNVAILGAGGFIGTNMILSLTKNQNNNILAVDESLDYFHPCIDRDRVNCCAVPLKPETDFSDILKDQDVVYHLVRMNSPSYADKDFGKDITDNLLISISILDACVKNKVKKVVFISSGGTVYGNKVNCPIKETDPTNPITTYGIQKITIEKLFYMYHHKYGLDYAIVRLANPYGPYQRPNGGLGVVTTFVYKALNGESLRVFGDGKVVRDYIYIDDAVDGIINIANYDGEERVFNLGSGSGASVNDLIEIIKRKVNDQVEVEYIDSRSGDVPVNVLDITKYLETFQPKPLKNIEEGIELTMNFFKNNK